MAVGLVAFHYPKPGYREEMIERVKRAADVLAGVAGCLEVDCWTDPMGGVVTTGKWESEEALATGFEHVGAARVDFEYDDREERPRQVFRLFGVYTAGRPE